jgi:hypothetical protein
MKQTSIEWLFDQIPLEWTIKRSAFEVLQQAKEMHKQEIIDAHNEGYMNISGQAEQYYQETFVSKGISHRGNSRSDEISDEEIKKSMRSYNITDFGQMAAYITGAQWYREQLKQPKKD